jgi:hypothetical protein
MCYLERIRLVSFRRLIKGIPTQIPDAALQWIFEGAIGIINIGESFGRFCVTLVLLRMPFEGEQLERNVNLALRTIVLENKNIVEIAPASWANQAAAKMEYRENHWSYRTATVWLRLPCRGD